MRVKMSGMTITYLNFEKSNIFSESSIECKFVEPVTKRIFASLRHHPQTRHVPRCGFTIPFAYLRLSAVLVSLSFIRLPNQLSLSVEKCIHRLQGVDS